MFFARRGEMASNRREDHEASMLALHLIRGCKPKPPKIPFGRATRPQGFCQVSIHTFGVGCSPRLLI